MTGQRRAVPVPTPSMVTSDPLQRLWLSRFGRTVADHVMAALSDRLSSALSGAQVTVGRQTVNLAETGDEEWLGRTLTFLVRELGAPDGPEPGGASWPGTDLGVGAGKSSAVNNTSAPASGGTMRDLKDRGKTDILRRP